MFDDVADDDVPAAVRNNRNAAIGAQYNTKQKSESQFQSSTAANSCDKKIRLVLFT